ncbi:hypothetical protein ACIQM4_28770 [Streptomyces sp. NPDC091272]|uniref:hypothetical protein n=1 Tax=Streptomyces sp. NPDC091272 TaxID=3365981 RepID=UPI003825660F
MTTISTPSPESVRRRRRGLLALIVCGVMTVFLLAAAAKAFASLAGFQVLSELEFRAHMDHTQEAGENTVRQLGLDPDSVVDTKEMASSSCVDDFGMDSGDVTRDQPTLTWTPVFADRAAYVAAVRVLREDWSAKGLTVHDVPAPAQGEPGAGLPGVRATDDHGVDLSMRPDWYSGEPVIRADGGCVRHEGYEIEWTEHEGGS